MIESHTLPILPVAVAVAAAAVAALESVKGSSLHELESQWFLPAEIAYGALYDG